MTSPALSALNALLDAESTRRYPNVPVPYIPKSKMKDTSANSLTQCILKWLRVNGHQAERINTQGRRMDQTRVVTDCLGYKRQIGSVKWCPGTGTRGSADISAVMNGRAVKIEVKWGKDKISADQIKYAESVTKAGGVYVVARTFQGFWEWYNANIQ